jgi:Uma2 family endonuclease
METQPATSTTATTPGNGWLNGAPPLENGDRLSRTEFERRYAAHPEIKKAELIEGIVYVASPTKLPHGLVHGRASLWLSTYVHATPPIRLVENTSIQLAQDDFAQPDLFLWLPKTHEQDAAAGQRDEILDHAPDLVIEIAASSAAYDLHVKMNAYQRSAAPEYVVFLVYERETVWFAWQDGVYHQRTPDQQGIIRSQVFPGLWLDTARFWADDSTGVANVVRRGMKTKRIESLQPGCARTSRKFNDCATD